MKHHDTPFPFQVEFKKDDTGRLAPFFQLTDPTDHQVWFTDAPVGLLSGLNKTWVFSHIPRHGPDGNAVVGFAHRLFTVDDRVYLQVILNKGVRTPLDPLPTVKVFATGLTYTGVAEAAHYIGISLNPKDNPSG